MTGIDALDDKTSGARVLHARAMELEEQVEKLIHAGEKLREAAEDAWALTEFEGLSEPLNVWRQLMILLKNKLHHD